VQADCGEEDSGVIRTVMVRSAAGEEKKMGKTGDQSLRRKRTLWNGRRAGRLGDIPRAEQGRHCSSENATKKMGATNRKSSRD